MKQCTCDSLDLFKGGCSCGSMLPDSASMHSVSDGVIAPWSSQKSAWAPWSSQMNANAPWWQCVRTVKHPQISSIVVPFTFPVPRGAFLSQIPKVPLSMYHWIIPIDAHHQHGLKNLSLWLPSDRSTGAPFLGVDRSIDPTRLAGIQYNRKHNEALHSVIFNALDYCAREGAAPNVGYCSLKTFDAIYKEISGLFSSYPNEIEFQRASDVVSIMPDPTITNDNIYLLTQNSWNYDTTNDIVYCINPGANCVIAA